MQAAAKISSCIYVQGSGRVDAQVHRAIATDFIPPYPSTSNVEAYIIANITPKNPYRTVGSPTSQTLFRDIS